MKKNITLSLSLVVIFAAIYFMRAKKEEDMIYENQRDQFVKELLEKMTIEEKAGEMTQLTIDMILKDNSTTEIDVKKLEHVIQKKHIGSIINVKGHAYQLETWHEIITAIQKECEKTRLKIPLLYGIDAIHGSNYIKDGTIFPHNITIAASRNKELVSKSARITALETRASGIRWNFDPVLGLGRQPLWSRFEETFGEDVYLTTEMGSAAIQSYEGKGLKSHEKVASCMKHYIGYSLPLSGKDRTPAYIPEYVLREYLLPPFAEAVKSGASTVMINSGEINGIPVHGSSYYLKDILRDELGFEGMVVTDWEDIIRLHTRHRVAKDYKEAVKIAIESGIDMSMVPYDFKFTDHLIELVKEGELDEDLVDESVSRILKLKYDLGLFDNPFPEKEAVANFGKKEYQEVALEAAQQSITLLKNDGKILPLNKNQKILLAGPGANNVSSLHGSWSYVWQGNNIDQYPTSTLTIKQALEAVWSKENVICHAEPEYYHAKNTNPDIQLKDVERADVIVLCLGEDAYAEQPGVINDLSLDKSQLALAEAAFKKGKKVILVLTEGRPRILNGIAEKVDAVLLAYRPASQGAKAIAQVLSGEISPSGRLPYTYPRFSGDVVLYDHKTTEIMQELSPGQIEYEGYNPQWTFGTGLSYSEFSYNDLKIDKDVFSKKEELNIEVKVANVGSMDSFHSVELYSQDLYASITPNVRRLKKFEKVFIPKGEEVIVRFSLNAHDLSMINAQGQRVTESGEFHLMIENLKASVNYQSEL